MSVAALSEADRLCMRERIFAWMSSDVGLVDFLLPDCLRLSWPEEMRENHIRGVVAGALPDPNARSRVLARESVAGLRRRAAECRTLSLDGAGARVALNIIAHMLVTLQTVWDMLKTDDESEGSGTHGLFVQARVELLTVYGVCAALLSFGDSPKKRTSTSPKNLKDLLRFDRLKPFMNVHTSASSSSLNESIEKRFADIASRLNGVRLENDVEAVFQSLRSSGLDLKATLETACNLVDMFLEKADFEGCWMASMLLLEREHASDLWARKAKGPVPTGDTPSAALSHGKLQGAREGEVALVARSSGVGSGGWSPSQCQGLENGSPTSNSESAHPEHGTPEETKQDRGSLKAKKKARNTEKVGVDRRGSNSHPEFLERSARMKSRGLDKERSLVALHTMRVQSQKRLQEESRVGDEHVRGIDSKGSGPSPHERELTEIPVADCRKLFEAKAVEGSGGSPVLCEVEETPVADSLKMYEAKPAVAKARPEIVKRPRGRPRKVERRGRPGVTGEARKHRVENGEGVRSPPICDLTETGVAAARKMYEAKAAEASVESPVLREVEETPVADSLKMYEAKLAVAKAKPETVKRPRGRPRKVERRGRPGVTGEARKRRVENGQDVQRSDRTRLARNQVERARHAVQVEDSIGADQVDSGHARKKMSCSRNHSGDGSSEDVRVTRSMRSRGEGSEKTLHKSLSGDQGRAGSSRVTRARTRRTEQDSREELSKAGSGSDYARDLDESDDRSLRKAGSDEGQEGLNSSLENRSEPEDQRDRVNTANPDSQRPSEAEIAENNDEVDDSPTPEDGSDAPFTMSDALAEASVDDDVEGEEVDDDEHVPASRKNDSTPDVTSAEADESERALEEARTADPNEHELTPRAKRLSDRQRRREISSDSDIPKARSRRRDSSHRGREDAESRNGMPSRRNTRSSKKTSAPFASNEGSLTPSEPSPERVPRTARRSERKQRRVSNVVSVDDLDVTPLRSRKRTRNVVTDVDAAEPEQGHSRLKRRRHSNRKLHVSTSALSVDVSESENDNESDDLLAQINELDRLQGVPRQSESRSPRPSRESRGLRVSRGSRSSHDRVGSVSTRGTWKMPAFYPDEDDALIELLGEYGWGQWRRIRMAGIGSGIIRAGRNDKHVEQRAVELFRSEAHYNSGR